VTDLASAAEAALPAGCLAIRALHLTLSPSEAETVLLPHAGLDAADSDTVLSTR
jgi:hypothetical protein